MSKKTKLNLEDVIKLLDNTVDCSVTIDPNQSIGHEELQTKSKDSNELVLTRADLEKLISTNKHIAFSSHHSSGVNNAGNHSSN